MNSLAGWIASAIALLNLAFIAGIQFGALAPLRKEVDANAREIAEMRAEFGKLSGLPSALDRLSETIERGAQIREVQATALARIETTVSMMQNEITRLWSLSKSPRSR